MSQYFPLTDFATTLRLIESPLLHTARVDSCVSQPRRTIRSEYSWTQIPPVHRPCVGLSFRKSSSSSSHAAMNAKKRHKRPRKIWTIFARSQIHFSAAATPPPVLHQTRQTTPDRQTYTRRSALHRETTRHKPKEQQCQMGITYYSISRSSRTGINSLVHHPLPTLV